MPAPQPPPDWRDQVLPALFWIGVALAPIAALLLLLGQGGNPLRIAAFLTLICVVLIGLSVALRQDVEKVRAEVEATVLDEADAIREETREDMVTVARKIHYALREEIAELSERVEEIRNQAPRRRPAPKAEPEPTSYNRGVVRRTETVRVTTSQTTVSDEPTLQRHSGHRAANDPGNWSATTATPAANSWTPRPPAARPALESQASDYSLGHSAAPRRWDPLSDDLADRPDEPTVAAVGHGRGGDHADGGRVGRRRAAEPEAPMPVAELESGPRRDPWADLRGSTQPAEVRFGAREPVSARSHHVSDYGSREYERVRVRTEPARPEPGPLDPGWRGYR